MTLSRRVRGGEVVNWRQPAAPAEIDVDEPETIIGIGRRVTFEIPDGFMATISLVPCTEPPSEPEEATS